MQLSKCDIFRIKSQTQQPKKKKIVKNCFLKHSKMGWMMMMLIKNICIYTGGARISCGIFTSKPPATPTFISPPLSPVDNQVFRSTCQDWECFFMYIALFLF